MVLVGLVDEKDIANGTDKKAVEQKKQETGLQYTETKIVKKNGKTYLKIWVCTAEEFTI